MTTIEERSLGALVSQCFAGGEVRRRELPLTGEQAGLIARRYPAGVSPMGDGWYEVTFQGGMGCEK